MNNKGPITLRKKKLKNGGYSLYLDYYQDGVRQYETLRIYLNPGTSPAVKAANKNAMRAAETILAKRLIELQSNSAGFVSPFRKKVTMLEFGDSVIQDYKKRMSSSYCAAMSRSLGLWVEFAGTEMKIIDITASMLKNFVDFLGEFESAKERNLKYHFSYKKTLSKETLERITELRKTKTNQEIAKELKISKSTIIYAMQRRRTPKRRAKLSKYTIYRYFAHIGLFLNEAVRQEIIPMNPIAKMRTSERPKLPETQRAHLSLDELRRLSDTPCKNEIDKMMFMFACFTGLRWSDVRRVTWSMIDNGRAEMIMKKTGRLVVVPISANAKRWLPDRGDASPDSLIFEARDLCYVDENIHQWASDAGIHKNVSFHVARHTFATLTLEYGADLYTVSKLLGHKNIAVTQIYAKIVDKKKEEAVNLIPDL